MLINAGELAVRDNEAEGQYEISYDGRLALLAYFRRGDSVVLAHTEVPEALEGHGIAGRLAQFALDDARAKGLRVVPRCPYVRAYLEKHTEYAELVATAT